MEPEVQQVKKDKEDLQPEGIEIARTPPQEEEVQEEDEGFQIGDLVGILGGRLNRTKGYLYGFRPDRMTILPAGVTDRVIHIPIVDGDIDPAYADEVLRLKKATRPGFVFLADLQAGGFIETFDNQQNSLGIFKVKTVDEINDSAVIAPIDDEADETEIIFGGMGIPSEQPFEVIRRFEPPTQEEGSNESTSNAEAAEKLPNAEADAEALPEEAELVFEIGEEIELPALEELQELSSSEKYYEDSFQRREMLGELIRLLHPSEQKNKIKLQEARRLVEVLMILRNEVVQYGVAGEPRGIKQTSRDTISQLIKSPNSSLTRKVVKGKKVLYLDHSIDHLTGKKEDPARGTLIEDSEILIGDYLSDILRQAEMLEKEASADGQEDALSVLPRFFLNLEKYRQLISTPIQFEKGSIPLERDEEAFFEEIPEMDKDSYSLTVLERFNNNVNEDPLLNPPNIKQTSHSIVRMRSGRVSRFATGELVRKVEKGEAPLYDNVLIFPKSVLRELGPIRSGVLAQDVSLGSTTAKLLIDILNKLGQTEDFLEVDKILTVGTAQSASGNIMITDWIKSQNLILSGIADAYSLLHGYGVKNIEWNIEQCKILQGKIDQTIGNLKLFLKTQREKNSSDLANLRFEPNNVLGVEESARLLKRVQGEPLLQKMHTELEEKIGELANIDINWFSYLFLKNPELLLSVIGQNEQFIATERIKALKINYLEGINNAYRLKKAKKERGLAPAINPCAHVKSLDAIRKISQKKSDEPRGITKMKLIGKLLKQFRGTQDDNWINCNVCKQHLLCNHEFLQVQEYARPKEQETLHKELLINYSGGQFGGSYICKVCGQTISELEFDASMEFDDEGRPMASASNVVEEREELDEIADLIQQKADPEDEIKFDTEAENNMYALFKKLAGLMGVMPEKKDFEQMIQELSNYVATLDSIEQYTARAATAPKGTRVPPYETYFSFRYATAAGAILLLNIQTRTPDYIIYFTTADCSNGFDGYPLNPNPEIKHGIECISSVLAGINDNEEPWNLTGMQRFADISTRREKILPRMEYQINELIKSPLIQMRLQKKRAYRKKVFGEIGDVKKDQVADYFRPTFTLEPLKEGEEVIIEEGASETQKAVAWIRSANDLAKQNLKGFNPTNPRSDQTCCLHSVETPAEFWQTHKMPELEPRVVLGPQRSATVSTTFDAETIQILKGTIDPKEQYKLFVKLCNQGPNKGLPHEIGLSLTCYQCGLNFTKNPFLPLSGNKEEDEKEVQLLKTHMEGQGVIFTKDAFEDLLYTAQRKSYISPEPEKVFPSIQGFYDELKTLEYQPIKGWDKYLNDIQTSLAEIEGVPTELQIVTACEEFGSSIIEIEEYVKAKLGELAIAYLKSLINRNPRETGENILTYFLVPFRRWVAGIKPDSFYILDSYELGPLTVSDIMTKGLAPQLKPLGGGNEIRGLGLRKVNYFIAELSEVCKRVYPQLKAHILPGGRVMLDYFMRAFVYGPLYRLLNPDIIPPTEEELGTANGGSILLKLSVIDCLKRFTKISSVPSETEIRTRLEERAEAEKLQFIDRLDKMAPDRKRVELVKKKFGLGEWSIGGTRKIREYSEEMYELFREQREKAGWQDYAQEATDGYDVAQMAADDY